MKILQCIGNIHFFLSKFYKGILQMKNFDRHLNMIGNPEHIHISPKYHYLLTKQSGGVSILGFNKHFDRNLGRFRNIQKSVEDILLMRQKHTLKLAQAGLFKDKNELISELS